MPFDLKYIYLTPFSWCQRISHYPNLDHTEDGQGSSLSVTCRAKSNCDLVLRDKSRFRDFEIPIGVRRGKLEAERRQKTGLGANAIGGFWYIEDQDFLHGWFYFPTNNYADLWAQVVDGRYTDCDICLGVEPIQNDVWNLNPLEIISAQFDFVRKPNADKPEQPPKGFFGGARSAR